jgi:hypothetical protein
MHLYHGRANAIHPYKNLLTQTKDVLCNPRNPDSKLIITGNTPLKYPSPPKSKTIYLVFVRNYARSSYWFESGFSGLTITSLV